jgi:AcrR family transcriptional regulator
MSNKMKKRTPRTDAEILRSIAKSDNEAEWSEDELNAYLREHGVDPSKAVNQVRAKIRNLLQGSLQQELAGGTADKTSPITSLLKERGAHGMSTPQLASACSLSLRLFAKLESGLLEYSSIPFEVIADVGSAIGRAAEDVADYLKRIRPSAQGAHFKADVTPVTPMQQNFFIAVAEDDSLTTEQRERFRALEEKYSGKSASSSQIAGAEDALADLPPPSPGLRAEVREIADEFADAFEEMKRRGD